MVNITRRQKNPNLNITLKFKKKSQQVVSHICAAPQTFVVSEGRLKKTVGNNGAGHEPKVDLKSLKK